MKNVNKAFRKKDAMQLVTGKPVYMDDLAPADCLIVKLYRSPHANAMVERIDTSVAKKVPGIEAIFTWEDVDQNARRYTQAGQTYPEASPYDRLVIDRHVRFVGDVVAIVVGKDEKCVEKAMKLIKVEYQVLEPVLDFHTAKDNPILVHPEDNFSSLPACGSGPLRTCTPRGSPSSCLPTPPASGAGRDSPCTSGGTRQATATACACGDTPRRRWTGCRCCRWRYCPRWR